ncbi:Uncharacterised protein [Mycobacteroides abscessus subsp. abscessus]|nr:Uncharacterised protein [Mycobacteroides abscessus subsp. abscessus]SHT05768.1 Uncharacterised protein [Mycobacteroides abscessus subsp. abscessus]
MSRRYDSYDVFLEARKLGYSERLYDGVYGRRVDYIRGDRTIIIQHGREGRILHCTVLGSGRWLGPRDCDKAGAVIHWMRQGITE